MMLVGAGVAARRWWLARQQRAPNSAQATRRAPTAQQHAATRLYGDVLRLLARHNLHRGPAQTPREFVALVAVSNAPLAPTIVAPLRELTELYNRAMWDPRSAVEELAALHVLVEQIRVATQPPR
jgi:hypothetical protein